MNKKILKGNLDFDHRGMIFEAYQIPNIHEQECRAIFLDWAIGAPQGDMKTFLETFIEVYGNNNPDHPMTKIILEGLQGSQNKGRRGGRLGRQKH